MVLVLVLVLLPGLRSAHGCQSCGRPARLEPRSYIIPVQFGERPVQRHRQADWAVWQRGRVGQLQYLHTQTCIFKRLM